MAKFITLIITFLSLSVYAQEGKVTVEQNPEFEKLLQQKRSLNKENDNLENRFKIQIFYGNSVDAKKELLNFKSNFKGIDVTIVYTNPTYKVWAGSFKTRIEAEKTLIDIKKKYPNALLIRPNS